MATYYSKHNAAGGGVGSFADPFTLQELLDNTDAGDLGLVCNTGTYTPSARIDVDNVSAVTLVNPAVIRGANADGSDDGTMATVSGSSLPASTNLFFCNTAGLSIRFEGIRMTAATSTNFLVSGGVNAANISLSSCRLDNSGAKGLECQETFYPGVTMIDCEIDNNTTAGVAPNAATRYTPHMFFCRVHDNGANGLEVGGNTTIPNPTAIIGNVFYDNGDNGVEIVSAVPLCNTIGNVFFGNTNHGLEILNTCYGFTCINNIFRSNGGYGVYTNSGSARQFAMCDYNCYSNNTSGALDIATPGGSNITSNPLFTSETDGSEDFTLQSGSPCKNVGLGYS